MSTATPTRRVDVAPARRLGLAHLALVLAVLAVPGSTVLWDVLPAGGFVVGLPLAVAALVLGLRARRAAQSSSGPRRVAMAAIVLAVAVLAIPVVYMIATV
jgi:hypothetical protein